jgi:uncharacterized damage-inducible protein DinB
MPQLLPPVGDERTAFLTYLDAQREGIRAAVTGLTDEQAASTPTVSSMSLAVLIKHVAAVERRWVVAGIAGRTEGLWPPDWAAEWRLDPGDTVDALLDAYQTVAEETTRIVTGVADLGQPCAMEDTADYSVRWVLFHLIEETARHAGHADILRESIDGGRNLDSPVR